MTKQRTKRTKKKKTLPVEANIELVDIDKLNPDPLNPRIMSDEMMDELVDSIDEYGFNENIVVNRKDMRVISGHQRIHALKLLNKTQVPVKFVDWNEAQIRGYNLAANNIRGENDMSKLATFVEPLLELDIPLPTGFNDEQLTEIRDQGKPGTQNDDEDDGVDGDEVLKRLGKPQTKLRDLYIIDGKHRILCGDSTVEEDARYLQDGKIPPLMVTDPPYGVDYDPKWRGEWDGNLGERATGLVQNDSEWDWTEAYKLFPGPIAYVWHAGKFASLVQETLKACGFEIVSQIVWVKQHFVFSRGDYHWQHEPCWYAVRKGNNHNWQGARDQSTTWQLSNNCAFSKDKEERTGHSTQKPVECMARPIKNNFKEGDIIYDPFIGSGSTLIAAEQYNRICYGIELEPLYCDVILHRYKASYPEAVIERVRGGKTEVVDIKPALLKDLKKKPGLEIAELEAVNV